MQKLAVSPEKIIVDVPKTDSEPSVLHFSLQGALPSGHIVALYRPLGTLSYLVTDGDQPRLVAQQQFTGSEMSLLLPLLDAYPYYCPYEVLFAHFYHTRVTEQIIEHCRDRLQQAQEEDTWDMEIRSMRNMLSRVRIKVRTLGMEISSLLETGYLLRIVSSVCEKSCS
jgi:hypothetical protein